MASHGKNTVVLMDNLPITRYLNESTITNTIDAVEVTCYGAPGDAREYIPGLREDTLTVGGFLDKTVDGGNDIILSYLGGNAEPNLTLAPNGWGNGYVAFLMQANETSYEVNSAVDDAVKFSLEFNSLSSGIAPGFILLTLTSQTASAAGTNTRTGSNIINLDADSNPAATANGYVGYFIVTAGTGAGSSIDATIYHGDGVTFVALAEFTAIPLGTGEGGFERMTDTGTVNSHVYGEIVLTAGGGAGATWTAALVFARL